MSDNKKKKPAAGKSVAGKTNSAQKSPKEMAKLKEKQKAEARKQAQQVAAKRERAERERAQKSREIQKRRAKQNEKEQKQQTKQQNKEHRIESVKNFRKALIKARKRFEYYTSKEFLGSFNYTRIFIFIVLPVIALCVGIYMIMQSPAVNVPSEIRNFSYSGKLEASAEASKLSEHQQEKLEKELGTKGRGKFDFYIKPEIQFDGNGETDGLCFGNSSENECVLIATVFDSEGEVLYRSLGLESGKEINAAKLFYDVSYGTHEVRIAVNAYNPETHKKIGTRYADITLKIED